MHCRKTRDARKLLFVGTSDLGTLLNRPVLQSASTFEYGGGDNIMMITQIFRSSAECYCNTRAQKENASNYKTYADLRASLFLENFTEINGDNIIVF